VFGVFGLLHAFVGAHDSLPVRSLNDGPNNTTSARAKPRGESVGM
jgi:hypothetical protein